jgi:hypothetical protein
MQIWVQAGIFKRFKRAVFGVQNGFLRIKIPVGCSRDYLTPCLILLYCGNSEGNSPQNTGGKSSPSKDRGDAWR